MTPEIERRFTSQGWCMLERLPPVLALGLGEDGGDEGEQRRPERDLEEREAGAEAFDDGVTARIEQVGNERKQDAEEGIWGDSGKGRDGGDILASYTLGRDWASMGANATAPNYFVSI